MNIIREFKLKINEFRPYVFFMFFKYMEFGVNAFLLFSLSNIVGPKEYGNATSSFLIVSYSAFAVLGANQVLLKWYSITKDKRQKKYFIQFNIMYNLFIGVILFSFISIFYSNPISSLVAVVSSIKVFQEAIINVNRVKGRLNLINIIYLSFSLSFMCLFFLYVDSIETYFRMWMISLTISVSIAILSIIKVVFPFGRIKYFLNETKNLFTKLITDGIKVALIGIIGTFILTGDRILLLNFTSANTELIGNMQLSDNIAMVISLGIGAIVFIISPQIVERLKNNEITIIEFYTKGYKLFALVFFSLLTFYFPLVWIINVLFPDFSQIDYFLGFYLLGRLLVVFLSIPTLICLTFSKETFYVRIAGSALLVQALIYIVLTYFYEGDFICFLLPLICDFILVCLSFYFYKKIANNTWEKSETVKLLFAR